MHHVRSFKNQSLSNNPLGRDSIRRLMRAIRRSIFLGDQYSKSHDVRLSLHSPFDADRVKIKLGFPKHHLALYDECDMNRERESGSLDSSVGRAFDCSG